MSKKIYRISMPITGYVSQEIEAESEEEAKDKFYGKDVTSDDIEEWDYCEEIVTGNVFHGNMNRMDIEEV